MALLGLVEPKLAEKNVKDIYALFSEGGGTVPLSVQMFSASPEYVPIVKQTLEYFMHHPKLSPTLLAHIRMLAAQEENYQYCVDLNYQILKNFCGLSSEQITGALSDPNQAVMEDREKEMLLFVLNVIRDPAMTTKEDIGRLQGMGWTDSDIFDSVQQAMFMLTTGILFKTFKMM